MRNRYGSWVVLACAVVLTVAGCADIEGKPTAEATRTDTSRSETTRPETTRPETTSETTASSQPPAAAPTGDPIGTATMKVSGAARATIRYQINGGAEQVVTDATLPWELEYPVYNEIQSSVTADAGDVQLICTIMMDGMLAAFKTEPRPTCSFAYY